MSPINHLPQLYPAISTDVSDVCLKGTCSLDTVHSAHQGFWTTIALYKSTE